MLGLKLKKEIEDRTRDIENGKASYESLAKLFGVSKSTVYKIHIDRLNREKEEMLKELKQLESGINELRLSYKSLEAEYKERRERLEQEYREEREKLESELNKIREQIEQIKSSFKRQNLEWSEGVEVLAEVVSLKKERELLQSEITSLTAEINEKVELIEKFNSEIFQLEDEKRRLQTAVNYLGMFYHTYLQRYRADFTQLSYQIKQLYKSINAHERRKKELIEEISELEGKIEELREEEKEKRKTLEKLILEREKIEEEKRTLIEYIEKERRKFLSEVEEAVKFAKKISKKVIEDAQREKERVIKEIEELKKQRDKLKNEIYMKIKMG